MVSSLPLFRLSYTWVCTQNVKIISCKKIYTAVFWKRFKDINGNLSFVFFSSGKRICFYIHIFQLNIIHVRTNRVWQLIDTTLWVTFSAPRYYCEQFFIGNETWIIFKTIKRFDVISASVPSVKGFFSPDFFIFYLQFDSIRTFFGPPRWSCSFFYGTLPKPDTITCTSPYMFFLRFHRTRRCLLFLKNSCLRPYSLKIKGKLRFSNGHHAHYAFSCASYDNNGC